MSETPVHEDPYPSQFAMEAAVELEINACLGRVQTQTVGKIIQRAIDKAVEAAIDRERDAAHYDMLEREERA